MVKFMINFLKDSWKIKHEVFLILLVLLGLGISVFIPEAVPFLAIVAAMASIPTIWGALVATFERRISIDTFNTFAIVVSFASREINSAAFIVLMLAFARILDAHTESSAKRAIEELMKLAPQRALREDKDGIHEIPAENIAVGDTILIKEGSRAPVDGVVIFGSAFFNEASLTGESVPLEKIAGDSVLSSTLSESGIVKIRATAVGKDSTIERMTALVKEASKNKSRTEKLADRFAGLFLPAVLFLGAATYFITKDIGMTAALFLVACADDIAVAIPLAITASLGRAAARGVVIKGGEWLEVLGKVNTVVLDKTGTLTYGTFMLNDFWIEPGVEERDFWRAVGIAEKFSEHPVGRALFHEAIQRADEVPSPDAIKVRKGSGIVADYKNEKIAIGDESIFHAAEVSFSRSEIDKVKQKIKNHDGKTAAFVVLNGKIIGFVSVADIPRAEAKKSIALLKNAGVNNVFMFTGDNEGAAGVIADKIGIDNFRAAMSPEDKLHELERFAKREGPVAMVGDGVNDAAALARADVGVAMGSGGTAVAVEAADVVVLNDDLSRLPEMILLGRKTFSVIRWDIVIWTVTNIVGFALVFWGIIGPALAAFYNFATDFLPLINSVRLFRTNTPRFTAEYE
ncbi:MAG: cation-translocating P-type ATPase [Parcubacteria group bacterium]|nr:cation-translocating P-type ATPase [Parcubacteria group bacterium]